MKVYEGFKDKWRNGLYTVSSSEGYLFFDDRKQAITQLKGQKINFNKEDLRK